MIDLLLDWYVAMGADEAIGETPVDRLSAPASRPTVDAASPPPLPAPLPEPRAPLAASRPATPSRLQTPASASLAEQLLQARRAAAGADTVAALRAAVEAFDGCSLKATATNTVFADGNPAAEVMFIGEAPGADEDRIGRPFVGVSGQLLDRMLATIGLDRGNAYITNVLFWRPPGNRKPSETEIALCRPFVERHIALVRPRFLILVGGTASAALVPGSEGITRLRGRWFALTLNGVNESFQTMAMYHPSFLLRSPERKREAWLDLLSLKSKLAEAPK
jgi:DNA polymerase